MRFCYCGRWEGEWTLRGNLREYVVGQENECETWCGDLNLAGVGGLVTGDGLDVEVSCYATI